MCNRCHQRETCYENVCALYPGQTGHKVYAGTLPGITTRTRPTKQNGKNHDIT